MTYWAYEAVSQCRAAQTASFTMETRQLFWMVNYSNFFWCNISVSAHCLQSTFLSTSDSNFFLSQLLLLISGDSTFAISDFSSPDDIYISCVSTLMILTSCTCASKSKDKQMSIRMDPATQQLTVFVNITREQSFFFFSLTVLLLLHVTSVSTRSYEFPMCWTATYFLGVGVFAKTHQ